MTNDSELNVINLQLRISNHMQPAKKVTTNLQSVELAEQKLNIKYPELIKNKMLEKNGFYTDEFQFYCIFDAEDKYHTFDDVVKENTNEDSGWLKYLPAGYVAIAEDGGRGCLALNTNKDGKIYYYENDSGKITVYAQNEAEIKKYLFGN